MTCFATGGNQMELRAKELPIFIIFGLLRAMLSPFHNKAIHVYVDMSSQVVDSSFSCVRFFVSMAIEVGSQIGLDVSSEPL